jgi:Transposase domain (DUF772)
MLFRAQDRDGIAAAGFWRIVLIKSAVDQLLAVSFCYLIACWRGESMIGTQVASPRLFYDFCLDDHVPSDHLLRRIDQFLDLESVRAELRPFYSKIGRPSIDPELMMRMLIIGYRMGIRSERRLCGEVHLNLAYRWFCR